MWRSIEDIDELLCMMETEHPKEYWKFIRTQHGLLYGNHYSEEFARWDIEHMKPIGMYWTKSQVEEATKHMSFPVGTTPCDKWVAFNATKNDLVDDLDDATILKVAHSFWFNDKDWKGGKSTTKIWEYMLLNHS